MMYRLMGLDTYSRAGLRITNNQELNEVVPVGQERESRLGMSSMSLDQHFVIQRTFGHEGCAQRPMTDGLAPLHEWTDHLSHHSSYLSLSPIAVALASLNVGTQLDHTKPWQSYRNVDVLDQPDGYNIYIKLIQDKTYRIRYPPTNASLEAIFNIVDGVIVIREVIEPMTPAHRPGDEYETKLRLPRWKAAHELLFATWMKLHLPFNAEGVRHSDYTGQFPIENITNSNDATLSRATGLGATLQLREFWEMRQWLNWIVVNDRLDPTTLQLIDRCLESRDHVNGHVPYYDRRETFARGHWAFYALLACDIGAHIVNFLALHKDNGPDDPTVSLGIKIVQSITIFKPESPEEMTDQERETYGTHPALIFEIKDSTQDLDTARRQTESLWSPFQNPRGYCNVKCPQI